MRVSSHLYRTHGSVGVRRLREPNACTPPGRALRPPPSSVNLLAGATPAARRRRASGLRLRTAAEAGHATRGEDAPAVGRVYTDAAGTAGRRGTTSGAPWLVGKSCWGRGGLLPSLLREVEGPESEAFSLFLSVEGCGHVVNLTCPNQAAGALSAGASPKLGPTTLHLTATLFCTLYSSPTCTSFSFIIIFFVRSQLVRSTFWLLRRGESGVRTTSE